jgi:hypothetical protein
MKYCTNCGQKLNEGVKFCTSCGEKIGDFTIKNEVLKKSETPSNSKIISTLKPTEINKINTKITLQNSQSKIVKKSWYTAIFFTLVIVVAILDFDGLPVHPAIVMISIFFLLTSLVVGFIFKSREKKLQSLITGENLIASWKLTTKEKEQYVNFLFKNEKIKNKGIFIITVVLIVIIFGGFIFFIEEGKAAMFFVMIALITFIALFAFGMPFYYKNKNLTNDGNILIGKKFAYINGYFHNWDFPLSGIKKVAIIKEPFYGLFFQYYYTDRTFRNTEEINIPAPENLDLKEVVKAIKNYN